MLSSSQARLPERSFTDAEVPVCHDRHNAASSGPIVCECYRSARSFGDSKHDVLVTNTTVACAPRSGHGGGRRDRGGPRDDESCVKYQEDHGIVTLTLNRPKVKNAFSGAMYMRVAKLLGTAARSDSVVAVILTGAGDYFTSGADIKEIQAKAVNGPAVGVGVTLLPHCDIVYAYGGASSKGGPADHRDQGRPAEFWTPFFRLAIVPEFCSSVTFPATMGWSLANEMLFMGRKLSTQEASSAGLISALTYANSPTAFLRQVQDQVRQKIVEMPMATDSVLTFKRVMGRNRRPMLLRVLAEEFVDLDRRMQAGHPQAALKDLQRRLQRPSSKL